jgi:Polysaccharide lyase
MALPAAASAGSYSLRPDGDVTSQWSKVGAPTAWEALDDPVAQPTSVGTTDYISAGGSGRVTEVSLGTRALSNERIDSGTAWFYSAAGLASSGTAELIWGGQVRGSATWGGLLGAAAGWHSIEVTPPDQAAVDDLRIRFTGGLGTDVTVRAAYFQLDTTPVPACPLWGSASALAYTLPTSCTVVRSDTAGEPNAKNLWGDPYSCVTDSRVQRLQSGGDPRPTAVGAPQGDAAYRTTTVLDGDDSWGERCELARNDWRQLATADNLSGSFYVYHEGERRATYTSVRLPASFPLDANAWQNVLQVKQAGPSNGSGGTPVLSIKAYNGQWILFHTPQGSEGPDTPIWQTPARKGIWTRVAIDALYSQDVGRGWVKLYVDGNGDGDFADSAEQSPVFQTNTLKRETKGTTGDGLAEGESIPSHLRAGIYHDSQIACPAPAGCTTELDNIQVVAP